MEKINNNIKVKNNVPKPQVVAKSSDAVKKNQEEQKESFYERNKTALKALAVIGIVTAGCLIAKKGLPSMKGKNLYDNLSREEISKLNKFKKDLSNLGLYPNKNSSRAIVKEVFNTENQYLKLEAAKHITSSPYLTADNYDIVFENVIKIKPNDKIKIQDINEILEKTLKELRYWKMCGEIRPNDANKIIEQISKCSDDIKISSYNSLLKGATSDILEESILTEQQLKRVLDDISTIKKEKINIGHNKEINLLNIKQKFAEQFLSTKKIDDNFIIEFKKLANDGFLADKTILTFIDKIYHSNKSRLYGSYSQNVQKRINILGDLLDLLSKNKENSYNSSYYFSHNKFDLYSDIIQEYDSLSKQHNIYIAKKKLYEHYKKLVKLADLEAVTTFNADTIKRIRADYLNSKLDFNYENLKQNIHNKNLDEIEDFVDKMLKDYENFVLKEKNMRVTTLHYDNLEESYKNFYKKIDDLFSTNSNADQSTKDRIKAKMDAFARKHNYRTSKQNQYNENWYSNGGYDWNSGWGQHSSGRTGNTGQNRRTGRTEYGKNQGNTGRTGNSGFNSQYTKSKKQQAIDSIIDFFKTEEGFEDEIAMLQKPDLTKKELVKIKRKFARKYHPDKFVGDSEEMIKKRAHAEEYFKKYNSMIEEIEKTLKD